MVPLQGFAHGLEQQLISYLFEDSNDPDPFSINPTLLGTGLT